MVQAWRDYNMTCRNKTALQLAGVQDKGGLLDLPFYNLWDPHIFVWNSFGAARITFS